jgi:hypothetical protein
VEKIDVPPMERPSRFGKPGNEVSTWTPSTKRFASMES